MAKKKKIEMMEMDEGKNKYSVFQWMLFVLVIPLLFALTIALIVMTVAGVNVFEKGKDIAGNIPGIAGMVNDDREQAVSGKPDKQKVVELQADIENKKAEIAQLESKLDAADQEIEKLLTEKDRLEVERQQLNNEDEETSAVEKKKNNDIVKTYESMSPKNIANILVNLSDNEAVGILSDMSTGKQGDILEKLPPDTAAKYTKLLSNQSS
jgi:flagellar motility protein MotE (MotC chaperone)